MTVLMLRIKRMARVINFFIMFDLKGYILMLAVFDDDYRLFKAPDS
jgi:hypothetical protein